MPRKLRHRKTNATGRSEGEGQFLPLPYSMVRSAAFRSLSGPALKVWIEVRARFNGANNGRLSLSWDEAAEKLGLSKTTVGRAFRELITKGFLRLRRAGHWYGRRAAEYIATDVKYDGHPATRDWERWRPDADEKRNPVSRRSRQPASAPTEYRASDFPVRDSTRQPNLRVIDGAA